MSLEAVIKIIKFVTPVSGVQTFEQDYMAHPKVYYLNIFFTSEYLVDTLGVWL